MASRLVCWAGRKKLWRWERRRKAFAAARANAVRTTQEQPDYPPGWLILGLLDAGLGHKSDAIAEGKRARELLPISKDALDGPIYATYLATIYAWVGEKDLAFEELELSTGISCGAQYGFLKLSPTWDSLRDDPRFEALLAKLAVDEKKAPLVKP